MEKLHLPDNLKVHFAAAEDLSLAKMLKASGINYALYSAYPFVYKKLFGKGISKKDIETIKFINTSMRHTIQDSGLFSLLFGSRQDIATPKNVYKWYDALMEFTIEHEQDVTCVEVDAQSIIGVDEVWRLREKMKNDLPNNRIINVFHVEDGKKGLDRMIEYSDYIAIGSSVTNKWIGTKPLTEYIKQKKPSIDIHLLGCTTNHVLRQCNYCTSADSTTWLRPLKYGDMQTYSVRFLDEYKVKKIIPTSMFSFINENVKKKENIATWCTSIEMYKRYFMIYAGNQDYDFY